MDPAALIPTPDTIPVPWPIFQILLTVTFLLHILFMNVMVGTAFIAAVTHLRNQEPGHASEIAGKLPYAIAFAVNFGVAPLLFVQVLYGHLIYTSSILMAGYWLSIIGLLILAYYGAYTYKYQYHRLADGRVLLAAAITLLLLTVGFFFVNNMTLMLHPESWPRYFDHPHGFLLNLADPTLIPRYLHFMVSAVAVGGLAIAVYCQLRTKRNGSESLRRSAASGCRWYGYATMVNFALGLWFLASLPAGLIPEDGLGLFFFALILLAMISAAFSVIFALGNRVMSAAHGALTTLILMILVRELLRAFYLGNWFSPATLTVDPTWTPFFLFLLFFIGGALVVLWMLKAGYRAMGTREERT